MASMLDVRTLTDGGQSASDVMAWITEFVDGAERSLDFAHYDLHLGEACAEPLRTAVRSAAKRGVAIRFLYNLDHRNPIPVPPPPEPDGELIGSFGVPVKAVAGVPDLMHHKYVVRDGDTVWTGSMNWTDDSFTRQENVVAIAQSAPLAAKYTEDFDELWTTGAVEQSGWVDPAPVPLDTLNVRAWFTPGYGETLSNRIGTAIARARRRVRICSPVLTAAPVLSDLAQVISEGRVDVAGCVDRPQLNGVIHQWRENGNIVWKLPLLERVLDAPFSGKPSEPWRPGGGVHDFMHAKVTVADDVIFMGSFNLSRSGEKNAENVLELEDAELADRLAGYVDDVRARYPRFEFVPEEAAAYAMNSSSEPSGSRK
jgi:phosphatidylserine/phosphatidylglycerophosphate/cardiolipin synthase-like enzyme